MTGGIFKNEFGLIAGHTYTILGVVEVLVDSKPVRLVKLRNPWSTDKYTGPWNNLDQKWNNETRSQAGVSPDDEFIFHVPVSQFRKMFGHFAVGLYHHTWLLSQIVFQPLQDNQKTLVTKIINPTHQELVATIDGMPARMLPETCAPGWPKNAPG